jgi:hypothetical protein
MSFLLAPDRNATLPTPTVSYPTGASAVPDVRAEALYQIYLKVLSTVAGPASSWVTIDPPSLPLLNHLKILGIASEASQVWHRLTALGWIETYNSATGVQARHTSAGRDQVVGCPAYLLQDASDWYASVLAHLYKH